MVEDARLSALADALRQHRPAGGVRPAGARDAAVALVVRPGATDLELLLIRRAVRERDPWSGHMAFPGGRRDAADASLLATAQRETHEEVGIDLGSAGRHLGPLDAVHPRRGAPPVSVSPYVFAVARDTRVTGNVEVHEAFWIPIPSLGCREARVEHTHHFGNGVSMRFPALRYADCVIWGLTYRILAQFLPFAGHAALPESYA